MQKYAIVAAGLLLSLALGATVFRKPIAWAAQTVEATITNVDANGNIKVHEQGTVSANVANLVAVHETGVATVEVMNDEPVLVSVRERPFQVTLLLISDLEKPCQPVPLELGKPFVLEAVAVGPATSNIPEDVRLPVDRRQGSQAFETFSLYGFHVDSNGLADKLMQLHVRPNLLELSADGDIIGLQFCWQNPEAPFNNGVHSVLSGHYE